MPPANLSGRGHENIYLIILQKQTAKDGMAGLQSGNKIWKDWQQA